MAIGVSVSISIGLPSAICLVILMGHESGVFTSAQKIYNGIDSFALLAIPLFVLAGAIMNQGGIASRLIGLAKSLTGPMPGALAQTNVLANMLFGAISGSALAGASPSARSWPRRRRRRATTWASPPRSTWRQPPRA